MCGKSAGTATRILGWSGYSRIFCWSNVGVTNVFLSVVIATSKSHHVSDVTLFLYSVEEMRHGPQSVDRDILSAVGLPLKRNNGILYESGILCKKKKKKKKNQSIKIISYTISIGRFTNATFYTMFPAATAAPFARNVVRRGIFSSSFFPLRIQVLLGLATFSRGLSRYP